MIFRLAITLMFAIAGCVSPSTAMMLARSSEHETETARRPMSEEHNALCSEQHAEQHKRDRQTAAVHCLLASHAPRAKATRATAYLSHLPGSEHAGRNGLGTALLN